jgi:tyrosyl-tRNA synthetase
MVRCRAVSVPPGEQLRILRSGAEAILPGEAELLAKLERGTPLRVKLGIDPSSPDIHIGHAVVLRKLRRFQQFGHTAVLIIGDFTGQVGDPTGRSETRKALSEDEVKANAETYVKQVKRILMPEPLEVRWNSEWLGALGTGGLLRLAGQMTVARMLERDDFSNRYRTGAPISIIEFMYPLLQGHDSVVVRADVELGGTDQTFNLLVGRDLQRADGQEPQIALTTPLLEGLDGNQKMSKSLGNYVGVADPPAEMFGKLMRVRDELLGKYLRLTTDLDPEEVDALEADARAGGPGAAKAKRRLAFAVTEIYHGAEAARDAESRFDLVHRERQVPGDIPEMSVPGDLVRDGKVLPAQLLRAWGLAGSGGEGMRLIRQGGVRIDGSPISEEEIPVSDLAGKVVQVGSRRFVRVKG